AALEMRFGETRRGFESRPLRHYARRACAQSLRCMLRCSAYAQTKCARLTARMRLGLGRLPAGLTARSRGRPGARRPGITQLELGTFRFPDPELADRTGVIMGYAIRHRGGIFLFDTGFGIGNAELDEVYRPNPKRIADALAEAGIAIEDVTAVANCHLHADHSGQNAA